MGLYNRFCKRFFAAVVIRLTAQSDSRAHPKNNRFRKTRSRCVLIFLLQSESIEAALDDPF